MFFKNSELGIFCKFPYYDSRNIVHKMFWCFLRNLDEKASYFRLKSSQSSRLRSHINLEIEIFDKIQIFTVFSKVFGRSFFYT